jgi:hypothetical protein
MIINEVKVRVWEFGVKSFLVHHSDICLERLRYTKYISINTADNRPKFG